MADAVAAYSVRDRPVTRLLLAGATCLLAAACGQGENDPGPGGVTVGEARALDEAAQMLEERRLSPQDLRPSEPVAAPSDTGQPAAPETGAAR